MLTDEQYVEHLFQWSSRTAFRIMCCSFAYCSPALQFVLFFPWHEHVSFFFGLHLLYGNAIEIFQLRSDPLNLNFRKFKFDSLSRFSNTAVASKLLRWFFTSLHDARHARAACFQCYFVRFYSMNLQTFPPIMILTGVLNL